MQEMEIFHKIVNATLGTFDQRQSYTPGMFEPLKPLFRELGFKSVAVYISDDYPDRMQAVCLHGDKSVFPQVIMTNGKKSLFDELVETVGGIAGVMTAKLYNHGRELGAVAAVSAAAGEEETRYAFNMLAKTMSIMAYLERIRTNSMRERAERDIFFAQSLTNRLLGGDIPKMKRLRMGYEFARALEAGGDFFDLIPIGNAGLFGYIGRCNGQGLRTVMEVCSIMRRVNRGFIGSSCLLDTMRSINDYLVKEKMRAHQASLCLFHIDTENRSIDMVKAGRLGLMLLDQTGITKNASTHSGVFLGMIPKPKLTRETFSFSPGDSFFCVTDGFYNSLTGLKAPPQVQWFLRALEDTAKDKPKRPLANAVFDLVNRTVDYGTRPVDSMLALSVEFMK